MIASHRVPAAALASLLLLVPAPSLGEAPTEAQVKAIRAEYKAIQDGVTRRRLKRAAITIGGRQNPNTVEVHHEPCDTASYEQNPYASLPLRIRRILVKTTLPAVGEAQVSFFFSKEGELLFAHALGADISGVHDMDLRPTDQLRVYFQAGQPIRLLYSGEPPLQVDLAVEKNRERRDQARKTGEALKARADELKKSLEILGK